MTEETKRRGFFGGIIALVQQWQVVVAAMAAVTALWFGFEEQRRKQLDINRNAVEAAKATATEDFLSDPYNTLFEFRVSFPEHAFCAALGHFAAEAGRQSGAGEAGARIKAVNDALDVQLERISAGAGMSLAGLAGQVDAFAGDGSPGSEMCPDLQVLPGWRAGLTTRPDCRVLLENYAQTRCQIVATQRRAEAVAAESAAVAMEAELQRVGPDEQAFVMQAPITEACGELPPTVYLQFADPADRGAAEEIRGRLIEWGWTVPAVELVTGAWTSGDVRFYWASQEACAAVLAQDVAGALGRESLAAISLEGRYRNLPRDRMEVWLPAGIEVTPRFEPE